MGAWRDFAGVVLVYLREDDLTEEKKAGIN